jgi:CDP-glucose 4,6-dehydratase
MHPAFWKSKRVLITGHTGFKGAWLSLWLQKLGTTIVGYSLAPPTSPSLFDVAHVADGMTSLHGDVRDLHYLTQVIAEYQPEVIIHMAAQSLVRRSYADPVETYSTNIMGTVNVLEAARSCKGVRVIINVTTDKCYENREWLWGYREDEPLGGHDPYSSSKACAELVTTAYRRSYFAQTRNRHAGPIVASARSGNVIGGGDWSKDRLVPDIVRALFDKHPVRIRNAAAVRPWQHVLEPLNGYISLAQHLWEQGAIFAEAWNFGPNENDAKPVSWITDELCARWDGHPRWERDDCDELHEAHYLKLDSTKARTRLNWWPKLDLTTAVDWVVEWYQAYERREDMLQVTRAQIQQYAEITRE